MNNALLAILLRLGILCDELADSVQAISLNPSDHFTSLSTMSFTVKGYTEHETLSLVERQFT